MKYRKIFMETKYLKNSSNNILIGNYNAYKEKEINVNKKNNLILLVWLKLFLIALKENKFSRLTIQEK